MVGDDETIRRNLNSQRLQVKLGLFGPGWWQEQNRRYSRGNAC